MSGRDPKELEEERRKYVTAFNSTMINIWKERIALLGVVRTGALYNSVVAMGMNADGKFTQIELSQSFNLYGLYVDYGTGREVAKGNGGDIGRYKVRQEKPWFSKKYYASVMNIRDFYADNLGAEGAEVISNALSKEVARRFLV